LKEEKKEKEKKKRIRKFPVGTRPGAPMGSKRKWVAVLPPLGHRTGNWNEFVPAAF
jgi:hypothetical protein